MNSSFPTNDGISLSAYLPFISLSLIVLFVSLPLNIYVSWLLVTVERHKVASEIFSMNLCVCEIIICFSALFGIFHVVIFKNNKKGPYYIFMQFVYVMHSTSRPFFHCCVCVERYVAVIHPLTFLKYKPLRYRTALSVIAWLVVLGFSVFCPFLQSRNISYYIILPEYLLVFFIQILCSIVVLRALKKPGPGEKLSIKDAESNCMKKKAFCVIVIILVFMFMAYCPMMTLLFVYESLPAKQKFDCLVAYSYFMILAGFVHPLLYLHRIGKFPFVLG